MDLRWMYYMQFGSRSKYNLTEREDKIVQELHQNGIAVVSNYWSAQKCARNLETMQAIINDNIDKELESGAYVRVKKETEHSDRGVVRIYQADKESDDVANFMQDESIKKIAKAYFGMNIHSLFSAFQFNKINKGETRGYHIDSFTREFKAFIYLHDVDEGAGPFTYLMRSHKSWFRRYKRILMDNGRASKTGFTDDECGSDIANKRLMVASKGSLILCDVSGFHRGAPQIDQTRAIFYHAFMTSKDAGSMKPEY